MTIERRVVSHDPESKYRLAWSAENDEGIRMDLFLITHTAHGELFLVFPDGNQWSTQVEIPEIAMFMASMKQNREDWLTIYLDEMVLNAKAALR